MQEELNEIKKELQEIDNQIVETRSLVDNADASGLDVLESKVKELETRQSQLLARKSEIEQRQKDAKEVANGLGKEIEKKGEQKMDEKLLFRSAWLNTIRGVKLTEEEKRALGSTDVNSAIPTQTQNDIIQKLKDKAPILEKITLLSVKGNVKYAVEDSVAEAEIHTENAAINDSTATLVTVELGGYEITKLVRISATVKTMTIDAFENWLVDVLSDAVAKKINKLIINGTGSAQPSGIEKANTWGTTNSVKVELNKTLAAKDVFTLIGLLDSAFDANATFVMSKKTLFTDFMPLRDDSKHNLVSYEGGKYYVLGVPVELNTEVKEHEAYLCDLTKYVANLPEDIHVVDGFDIDTNSYKYLGVSIFDGKPALKSAFVKLVKATS